MLSPAFQEIFAREGELQVASGNTPFLPADPASVWWVERGGLELFSVRIEAGEPSGNRQHFCSVPAGDALFGTGPAIGGRGLLAVGLPDTRLWRLPLARLRALATEPAFAPDVAALLESWIGAVSQGASRDVSPRTDCLLDPVPGINLAANVRFRSRRGVVWLRAEQGDFLFIGMEELPLAGQPVWFPVAQDAWLQALGPARVQVHATAAVLARDELWNGFTLFTETVGQCEAINRRLGEVDDLNRQNDRAAAGRRATTRALDDLASVLTDAVPAAAAPVDDPLFLACLALGRAQGIAFQPPPELLKGEPSRDPVVAIARASRVRVRPVKLSGLWWTEEAPLPLLAFRREGHGPVALVSERPGRLELHDPGTGARQPVTSAVAAELEPDAFVFHRSLTAAAVSGWELLRLGARGMAPDFARLLLFGLGAGLLGTLPVLATAVVFNTLVPVDARGLLLQVTLGLFGVAVTGAVFEVTRGLALLRLESRLDRTLPSAVVNRLLTLPATFFRQFAAGDLAQRVEGVSEIRRLLSAALVTAGLGSLFAWVHFLVLLIFAPTLAVITGGLLVFACGFSLAMLAWQLRVQRRVAAQQGRISGLVLQLITGIAKLRVAAAEDLAFAAWAREFAVQKRDAFHARRLTNHVSVFNVVFPLLATAAIFWGAAAARGGAGLPVGSFLALLSSCNTLLAAVVALTGGVAFALNAVPLFERVRPILHAAPEAGAGSHDPGTLGGRIELSHVSFRYAPDSPLVLDDVSLDVAPGELVAIVGASGSGKSTLLRLLLGFDAPQTGAILYDGQDLARLDVTAVRRQIGTVLQTNQTMAGSLRENIVGSRQFTDDEAWAALRLVGLDEEVRALPMGLRTVMPAGGGVFSGGQRQRLMIARALIGQPRILLFDEATSSLDNRTQAIVSTSLARLQATRLVIAHRLSTIRGADRIVVLEAGRVAQTGTYQELLHAPGPFAKLARRQLSEA